jgi:hypothetical protein
MIAAVAMTEEDASVWLLVWLPLMRSVAVIGLTYSLINAVVIVLGLARHPLSEGSTLIGSG